MTIISIFKMMLGTVEVESELKELTCPRMTGIDISPRAAPKTSVLVIRATKKAHLLKDCIVIVM